VVAVLVVISLFAGACAAGLAWGRATLVDTDGYVDAMVRPLINDPAVKDALATELANRSVDTIDFSFLVQFVPAWATDARAAMTRVANQMEQAWKDALQPSIRKQLDGPTFPALWEEASASAQRQLIAALSDGSGRSTVVIDLHDIVVAAVRDSGAAVDQQLGLQFPVMESVYDGMANSLPPEVGQVAVDVSRVGKPARNALARSEELLTMSLIVALAAGLLAIALGPRGRKGTVMVILGTGLVLGAGALWWSVRTSAAGAGDRAAALSVQPLSAEVRFMIDAQAKLAAASVWGWAAGLALLGLVLALVGGFWRLWAGRRYGRVATPGPDGGYGGHGGGDWPAQATAPAYGPGVYGPGGWSPGGYAPGAGPRPGHGPPTAPPAAPPGRGYGPPGSGAYGQPGPPPGRFGPGGPDGGDDATPIAPWIR
jgi:hypothetical protein